MDNSKQILVIGVLVVAVIAIIMLMRGKSAEAPAVDSGTAVAPVTAPSGGTGATSAAAKPPAPVATSYPSMTKEGIYLIYYTSAGFRPQTLEIPLGKSVRFINESGKAMRIASTDSTNEPMFAAFNQPKTVGQGGIYEYTFVNRARFSYKNLNAASDQGVIIVK